MRERRSGTIVDISSVSRCMAGPRRAWNHCTEVAVEAVSDRLRLEVEPFGIGVIVIEPDAIRTEFAKVAVEALRAASASGPYGPLAKAIIKSMANEDLERRKSPPTGNCRRSSSVMIARHPNPRYIAGFITSLLLFARRMLPDTSLDAAVTAAFATQA